MSDRWGDSRADRMELDRWITREDDTMDEIVRRETIEWEDLGESGYDGPIPATQEEADSLLPSHPGRVIFNQRKAIEAGMWQWEPGTLTRDTLRQIATAALHDVWTDSYRQGAPVLQRKMFRERVEALLLDATGESFRVLP